MASSVPLEAVVANKAPPRRLVGVVVIIRECPLVIVKEVVNVVVFVVILLLVVAKEEDCGSSCCRRSPCAGRIDWNENPSLITTTEEAPKKNASATIRCMLSFLFFRKRVGR